MGKQLNTAGRVQEYVQLYYDAHRVTPALEQIAKYLGKTKPTVQYHINQLLKSGKLEKRLDGRAYPVEGFGEITKGEE